MRFDELSQKPKADDERVALPRETLLNDKDESDAPGSVALEPQSENATGGVSLDGAATLAKPEGPKRGGKRKSQSVGPEAVPDTNVPEDGQKPERKKRK